MKPENVVELLRFAGAHLTAGELFRGKLMPTQMLLERLENHAELIAEMLTVEEESSEPVKFHVVVEKI